MAAKKPAFPPKKKGAVVLPKKKGVFPSKKKK